MSAEPTMLPTALERYEADDADRSRQGAEQISARIEALQQAGQGDGRERPVTWVDQGIYSCLWVEPIHVGLDFDLLTTDRRSGETHAELSVTLDDPASGPFYHRTRLNLLSTSAIDRLAKGLVERTRPLDVPWRRMLDQATQWAVTAYRRGEPAIVLRDAPSASEVARDIIPDFIAGSGMTCIFGDGGSAKSILLLATAASLHLGTDALLGVGPERAYRVLYCDWEDESWVHRDRLEQLSTARAVDLPDFRYLRMGRSLPDSIDQLRRTIRDHKIEVLAVDSIAPAAGGEPQSPETAIAFFGAIRQLGLPVIATAHNTKVGDDQRPFGSVFWANLARRTWFVGKQQDVGTDRLTIGLYNRKSNLSGLAKPVGYQIEFGDGLRFTRADLTEVPELAERLPIRTRLVAALRTGAKPLYQLAEELDESTEAVRIALKRGEGRRFIQVARPDGTYRWGLKE